MFFWFIELVADEIELFALVHGDGMGLGHNLMYFCYILAHFVQGLSFLSDQSVLDGVIVVLLLHLIFWLCFLVLFASFSLSFCQFWGHSVFLCFELLFYEHHTLCCLWILIWLLVSLEDGLQLSGCWLWLLFESCYLCLFLRGLCEEI